MRERGLKSIMMILWKVTWIVAPRAGAWIEIFRRKFSVSSLRVAPRAGAWIEIKKEKIPEIRLPVAPRAGAWIEIEFEEFVHDAKVSLPVRERGLKFP